MKTLERILAQELTPEEEPWVDFSCLPDDGIIFLDTCASGLIYGDPKNRRQTEARWDYMDRGIIDEEALRLGHLMSALSKTNNFLTIKQVIMELSRGNTKAYHALNATEDSDRRNSIARLIETRKEFIEMLAQPHVDARSTEEVPEKLIRKMETLYLWVVKSFKENRGLNKPPYTDTTLISTALGYASDGDQEVYMFSDDFPLVRTYAQCAGRFGVAGNTHVIDERNLRVVSTGEFLETTS